MRREYEKAEAALKLVKAEQGEAERALRIEVEQNTALARQNEDLGAQVVWGEECCCRSIYSAMLSS